MDETKNVSGMQTFPTDSNKSIMITIVRNCKAVLSGIYIEQTVFRDFNGNKTTNIQFGDIFGSKAFKNSMS